MTRKGLVIGGMNRKFGAGFERANTLAILRNVERFQLPTGLSRKDAWDRVRHRCKHDHRGFTYDSKTGKAVCT